MYFRPRFFVLLSVLALGSLLLALPQQLAAQPAPYDASWYDPDASYAKIAVAEDGVYKVTGQDLANAGFDLSGISPSTLRLFESGQAIPLRYVGAERAPLQPTDHIAFVGQRNRGTDELWAYNFNSSWQSSAFRSLYTDTTYYWLTWGGSEEGQRYAEVSGEPQSDYEAVSAVRDTLHWEQDKRYYYGDAYQTGDPRYTRGEGYYWSELQGGSEWTPTFSLPGLRRTSNDRLHLRVRLNGKSRAPHEVHLEIQQEDGFVPVDTTSWHGYGFQTLRADLLQTRLPEDEPLQLRVSLSQNDSDTPNRVLVDLVEVDYVRTLEANGQAQAFTLPNPGTYNVTLSGYDTDSVHVFNEQDRRHLVRTVTDGEAAFGTTPSAPARYWIVSPGQMRTPPAITKDASSDLAAPSNAADYVILTTNALHASAQQLAAYRRSENGGGHTVKIVHVQNVFDQFDHGRPTPVAIRRFMRASQQWQTPPRFLCIWADAPHPIRTSGRYEGHPSWAVISYGYAPSDGWFAMQTEGINDWTEFIAVGRVPIRTNAEGSLFLQKVQTHEAAGPAPWRKRMLVLAGGTSQSQQAQLQGASNSWALPAAQPPTGMDTLKFYKESDASLDNSFQDSLSVALQQGASWLNYFGHSAANTWEIVTDPPSSFDNAGRLPFVVSLGCRTGSFAGGRTETRGSRSFGELLLLGGASKTNTTSSNGAIAHFGASSSGTIGASQRLNDKLIDAVFRDTMHVMGLATQAAKNRYARGPNDIKHSLQYGLLGDPAARFAIPRRPDPKIAAENIEINPLSPVPADSQLTVRVHLQNLGMVPRDSFTVSLAHLYKTDGAYQTVERYTRRVAPFRLSTTLSFALPIDDSLVGEHRVTVQADPDEEYVEISEANNEASKDKTVFSTNVTLISPRDLGLVTTPTPTLRVSLASADQIGTPVRFELSETSSFESLVTSDTVRATRIDAAWQPSMPLQEGGTYFWRARVEAAGGADTWSTSSFTVRSGLSDTGWLQQGALFQFSETDNRLHPYDERWSFASYNMEVLATSNEGNANYVNRFTINGAEKYEYLTFGLSVLILDGQTGRVRDSDSFCTYDIQDIRLDNEHRCTGGVEEEAAIALMDSLVATARTGDYIFTSTRNLVRRGSNDVQESVERIFGELGSTAIDTLQYSDLWLMKARKGYPSETEEMVNDTTNEISWRKTLSFTYPSGTIQSPLIGPSTAWKQLAGKTTLSNDASNVQVNVLSAGGDTLLSEVSLDTPTDLSGIDAAQHRYLRLQATLVDSSQASTPQLQSWHVTHDGVSDLAIDPTTLVTSADTLQKGAPMEVEVDVRNLSELASEQAVVRFVLTNQNNQTSLVHADTLSSISADTARTVRASFSTEDYVTNGKRDNRLRVTVEQPGVPEPVTHNNILLHTFRVQDDTTPPQFSVTVDGEPFTHNPDPLNNLQDPEIPFVSARPTIRVEIEDNSNFLPITDADLIDIYLNCDPEEPSTSCETVSASDTSFAPVSRDDSTATVTYRPDLTQSDTTHTLHVLTSDASGNEKTFRTYFRVQQDIEVENLYPYPNPMHSFTRFAFRLRGADLSRISDFRLRIFTVNGRLIRELDLKERGLRIGWNRIPWDTRDADGDLIASGVYLYKVYLRADGKSLPVNGDAVEKLVVLR